MKKKILFVTNRFPYPLNRGDVIRSYHFLKYLGRKNDITLLSFGEDGSGDETKLPCQKIVLVRNKRLISRLNFFAAIFGSHPSIVASFSSRVYNQAAQKLLRQNKYDLIFCKSSVMAQYFFRPKLKSKLVVDLCDVDSDRYRQYLPKLNFITRFFLKREIKKISLYEKKIFLFSRKVILSSPSEGELIDKKLLGKSIFIKNGVDFDFFKPRPGEKNEPRILFTGMMKYFPNAEAVEWFAKKVFPKIHQAIPKIKFMIVGQQPPPKVLALKSKEIIVTGTVRDIRPYYRQASVFVAPLSIARGMQNKVLEALAMNLPCVVSAKVAAGLGLTGETDFLKIAQNKNQFAQKTIDFLSSKKNFDFRAREFVKREFNWQNNLSALDQIYE